MLRATACVRGGLRSAACSRRCSNISSACCPLIFAGATQLRIPSAFRWPSAPLPISLKIASVQFWPAIISTTLLPFEASFFRKARVWLSVSATMTHSALPKCGDICALTWFSDIITATCSWEILILKFKIAIGPRSNTCEQPTRCNIHLQAV